MNLPPKAVVAIGGLLLFTCIYIQRASRRHRGKREILFVTSSDRKVKHLRTYLQLHGLADIYTVTPVDLSTVEIQGDPEQVAVRKAVDAYALLKRSLVVEDSAFHVHALHMFPGIYGRYVLGTLGADAVAALLDSRSRGGREDLCQVRY
jgi:inosine/xanthosine triphosphate pyrophosphatase family protein